MRNAGLTGAEQALLDAITALKEKLGRMPWRFELAEELGIKEGTVESRIQRMRDKGVVVPSAPIGRRSRESSAE